MRTTLVLQDALMAQLRGEAAARGLTMSAIVEQALRAYFLQLGTKRELPPLPVFHGGGANVDVADREALEEFLEQHDRRDERLYGRRG